MFDIAEEESHVSPNLHLLENVLDAVEYPASSYPNVDHHHKMKGCMSKFYSCLYQHNQVRMYD